MKCIFCSSFSSLIYKSSVWMGKGIPFKSHQWQLARKSQWCYTKKEYKVTDFQRQCYKSILILEVNFLTLWILAIIPRQAIFAMLKTWILTFLNNLWTMPTKSWALQYLFSHIYFKAIYLSLGFMALLIAILHIWRFTVQYLYVSLYPE